MKRLALAAAFLVAGCAASGVQVKEEQLAEFQKGKTTLNEVMTKLGSPTSNMLMPDGTRTISYTYVAVNSRPGNFVPIVGPLLGGHDVRSNMVMLSFDRNGVLQSTMANSTQRGTGRGISSGTGVDERVEQQPRQAP